MRFLWAVLIFLKAIKKIEVFCMRHASAIHGALLGLFGYWWAMLGLGFVFSEAINDSFLRVFFACPHQQVFQKPCILCGGTTAIGLFVTGDFNAALSVNPFAVGLLPILLLQPLYRVFRLFAPRFVILEECVLLGISLCFCCVAVIYWQPVFV